MIDSNILNIFLWLNYRLLIQLSSTDLLNSTLHSEKYYEDKQHYAVFLK